MSEPYGVVYAECVICGRVTTNPIYTIARGPSCREHEDDDAPAPRRDDDAAFLAWLDRMERDAEEMTEEEALRDQNETEVRRE